MSSLKLKGSKNKARHDLPEDVSRLIELIIREIQSPADMQNMLDEMPTAINCPKEAIAFLKAKDRAQRRESFIKTESLWFNKYGWFMARIVVLFGILVLIFALLARGAGVDFITAAILGAAGYYALLVTLSNLRYRDNNKKRRKLLDFESRRYQRDIAMIASSLLKQFQIDPRRYPVINPKSKDGLEQREDGYFFPT